MKRFLDLREQALAALASGMKRSQVSQVFGIHRTR
jgi:outer membrane protein assembly factor BamE (lipoprotein component of BamABCDE complex)